VNLPSMIEMKKRILDSSMQIVDNKGSVSQPLQAALLATKVVLIATCQSRKKEVLVWQTKVMPGRRCS
jgi:hypothetical protein